MRRLRSTFRRFTLLAALFGALAGASAPAAEADDPFDRVIRLDLWGRHLGEAISQITERSGVDVRVSPRYIHPREFPLHVLYLKAGAISARQAVEWLSRALDCRYRIDGPHAVWLTGGYDWLKQEPPEIMIENLGGLVGPRDNLEAFQAQLSELVKTHALFQIYSVRLESPDLKLVAILPDTLKTRLQQALVAMSNPGEPIRPPAPRRLEPGETELLERLQAKVVANYRQQDLLDVLVDLSLQSNLNLAFDHDAFPPGQPPRLDLSLGETSVRHCLETLATRLGLGGVELYPPREKAGWRRAASRAFLWENLVVKGYAVRDLATRLGSGEVLILKLRERVCPYTWQDPSAAMVFHQRSGNLIVIAPPEVQAELQAELYRLQTAAPEPSPR